MNPSPTLADTIEFAIKWFGDRKDQSGVLLWKHGIAVFEQLPILAGIYAQQVAILHDVIEDTDCNKQDILDAGFAPVVAHSVQVLSRDKNKPYFDYIRGLISPIPVMVKIADNFVNMERCGNHPNWANLRRRYEMARPILLAKAEELGVAA